MAALRTVREMGALIRSERERFGLTQSQLAESAGVSRRWLIATEQGEHARAEVDRLLRVLDALGITLRAVTSGLPERPHQKEPARQRKALPREPVAERTSKAAQKSSVSSKGTPRSSKSSPIVPPARARAKEPQVDLNAHMASFRRKQ